MPTTILQRMKLTNSHKQLRTFFIQSIVSEKMKK